MPCSTVDRVKIYSHHNDRTKFWKTNTDKTNNLFNKLEFTRQSALGYLDIYNVCVLLAGSCMLNDTLKAKTLHLNIFIFSKCKALDSIHFLIISVLDRHGRKVHLLVMIYKVTHK